MSYNLKPHFAILGANIIYGINYSIAKDVMPNYVDPFALVFCRIAGAFCLFWIVHSFTYQKIDRKDLLLLATCGFFGVFANQMMFLYGLNLTTPINAGIIMVSSPVLVLVTSAIVLKHKITLVKTIGIVLGIAGALLLLLLKQDFSFGSENITGNLFIFLNALSYGIYLVIVTPLMKKYQPLTVIKWVFTFGFIFVLPFGLKEFNLIEWDTFTPLIWFEFSFVIIATTFFAYLLNIYGLKNLTPTIVSAYIYLQPILASVFAIWAGKDSLDWIKIIATIFIFSGVYLVSHQKQ